MHSAYETKLRQMRFATPLLQALARQEVLEYRLQRVRRQAEALIERQDEDPAAVAELEGLRERYQQALREQDGVKEDVAAEAARFRREFGEDFTHRGQPVRAD